MSIARNFCSEQTVKWLRTKSKWPATRTGVLFFQSYISVSTAPSNGVHTRHRSVILLHIFQVLEPQHHVMVHPVHSILLKDNTCDHWVSRLTTMWQYCSQDTARCSRICRAICRSLKINVLTSLGSDTLLIESVRMFNLHWVSELSEGLSDPVNNTYVYIPLQISGSVVLSCH
jgi:hypothetical protein